MEKNEIFELYDSNEAKLKPNSKLDRYERDKQIKKYIKRETNLNLLDTINLIEDTNPFNYGYTIRTDYQRLIDDRKTLKDQDKVKKTFGALREDKSSDNKAEPMIERHIMLSDKYIDILGKPLFYEFPPNVEKDNTGEKDIDLITYDENKKIINLIELKKCSYIKEKNNNNVTNIQNTSFIYTFVWEEGGNNVKLIGSFSNWKDTYEMKKDTKANHPVNPLLHSFSKIPPVSRKYFHFHNLRKRMIISV